MRVVTVDDALKYGQRHMHRSQPHGVPFFRVLFHHTFRRVPASRQSSDVFLLVQKIQNQLHCRHHAPGEKRQHNVVATMQRELVQVQQQKQNDQVMLSMFKLVVFADAAMEVFKHKKKKVQYAQSKEKDPICSERGRRAAEAQAEAVCAVR